MSTATAPTTSAPTPAPAVPAAPAPPAHYAWGARVWHKIAGQGPMMLPKTHPRFKPKLGVAVVKFKGKDPPAPKARFQVHQTACKRQIVLGGPVTTDPVSHKLKGPICPQCAAIP